MVPPSPGRPPEKNERTGPGEHRAIADIRRACELFKTAADPHRIAILLTLEGGPRTVTSLIGEFPDATDQLVSRHLGVLRRAGLVECEVDGVFRIYRLTEHGTRLARALAPLDPG